MSRRNSLLYFSTGGRGAGLSFIVQDQGSLFARLLTSHAVSIEELQCELEPDERDRRLSRLRDRTREDLNDRGVNTLYMAFGILEWREADSSETIRSPLVLVPVTLTRASLLGTFSIARLGEEECEVNPTLSEKLRNDFDIQLPSFARLAELSEQAGGGANRGRQLTLAQALDAMRAAIPSNFTWSVNSEVALGRFNFQKLSMYRDLQRHEQQILSHDLLRQLGGDIRRSDPIDLIPASQLDDRVRPQDMLEVLDADSSQQEAIAAAKAGASFVLQGPPGTGKSQTIANMIAEMLGQGKRILFVSEKRVALDVVLRRLEEAKLGEYCLQLHDPKADKRVLLNSVSAAMKDAEQADVLPSDVTWEHTSQTLQSRRDELNQYVRELHLPRPPLHLSAFDALGILARLEGIPDRDFALPNVETMTASRLEVLCQTLARLADDADVLDRYTTHPWRYARMQAHTLELDSSIRDHFGRLSERLKHLHVLLLDMLQVMGEEHAEATMASLTCALERAEIVMSSPLPPLHWLLDEDIPALQAMADEVSRHMAAYLAQRERLERVYRRSLVDLDHDTLLRSLTTSAEPLFRAIRAESRSAQDMCIVRRRDIDRSLQSAIVLLAEMRRESEALATASHQDVPETVEEVRVLVALAGHLVATPNPPQDWLDSSRFAVVRATASDVAERYARCAQMRAALGAIYNTSFFELDLQALASRARNYYHSPLRYLRRSFYQDQRLLRSCLLPGQQRNWSQMAHDLEMATKLLDHEQGLREQQIDHARILDRYFDGKGTDWQQLDAVIAWIAQLFKLLPGATVTPTILKLITGPAKELKSLRLRQSRLSEMLASWDIAAEQCGLLLKLAEILEGDDSLEKVPMSEALTALERFHASIQQFWNALDGILSHRLDEATGTITWQTLCDDLRTARSMKAFEGWLHEQDRTLRLQFRHFFTGLDTNWMAIDQALAWVDKCLNQYPNRAIPERMARLVSANGDPAEREHLRAQLVASKAELPAIEAELAFFDTVLSREALCAPGVALEHSDLATVAHNLDTLVEQLPELVRWLTCQRHLRDCRDVGLGSLIQSCLGEGSFPRDIVKIFERRFYVLWLDHVRSQSPVLASFSGHGHSRVIQQFRQLDEDHKHHARGRLRHMLTERRRRAAARARAEGNGDAELSAAWFELRKELQKKRHRSIRHIVRQVAPALLELKPCWMMSPLSVSQFLESADPLFDVVIFDEASQVCTEDAICAILRGKKLIVVGDSKQLPPTRFFSRSLADVDDEQDEETAEEERTESILEACQQVSLSERSLKWHYRSAHESLIAFSNHHFYGNELQTFPSPTSDGTGVRFEFVEDGIYDRSRTRQNRREAQRVAELVYAHVRHHPERSLGVVALSQAQQEAIRDAIERQRKIHPELSAYEKVLENEDANHGFFIKNLESVQGDERDVIILSVGYGRDSNDKIYHNFGPVNNKGGERRLNVAVTRAREQLILVSSMRAKDLPQDLASPGARTLRYYLEYAERGTSALVNQLSVTSGAGNHNAAQDFDSPFEEAVYAALTARGLQLDKQVGCSGYRIDFAVRDPNNPGIYLLGIECDGRTYHSSKTARDRDRLRQRHLERMGWTLHRIWSTDWFTNSVRECQKVLDAVERAKTSMSSRKLVVEEYTDSPPHESSDLSPVAELPPRLLEGMEEMSPDLAVTAGVREIPGGTPSEAVMKSSHAMGSLKAVRVPQLRICEDCKHFMPKNASQFQCGWNGQWKSRSKDGHTPACNAWLEVKI